MENFHDKLMYVLKSKNLNKKEEIFQLDAFINNFQSEEKFDNPKYHELFQILIEFKLTNYISTRNSDYLYLLKILQTIRLLTRNNTIREKLSEEKAIKTFEKTLEDLIGQKSLNALQNDIIQNCYIEITSIIKRYFFHNIDTAVQYNPNTNRNLNNEVMTKIINETNIIDHLISLLSHDNTIVLKLIHLLLISVIENDNVIQKFIKTHTVENMIIGIRDKHKEVAKMMLDFITILVENKEFRNLFMFLEGHHMLVNKIKNYEKSPYEKELILRILYAIQAIYKNEESLGEFINTNLIANFFLIMSNEGHHDYSVNKIILNILSAFAMNDDLNIFIRINWLEALLKILINYTFNLRAISQVNDSAHDNQNEMKMIIFNQTLIARILRLIFSLEKNRKFFKQIFPTKILGLFIDIGNYKHNLNLYNLLISEFNTLSDEELYEILQKSENLTGDANYMNQTVGGYTIVDLIGKGGFGSVFKVKIGNQNFAMKEIKLDYKEIKKFNGNTSTQNLEKFIKEIEIWKELDHPNIIKYYTSFMEREKSSVYIIMELIEGVNLTEYIKNFKEKGSKPKEKDVIRIIIDIISGLKYLHKDKGIIYRDFNPHNIMLDNNCNIKMGDFGLAKKLKEDKNSENDQNNLSHSMSNNFVGSILYSSPEMIKNQEYIQKSDLWSFGCIIYQLLTLAPPFEGDNPLTVARNIVELNYKKLKKEEFEFPVLITIIERCLHLDSESRCDIEEICGYLGPYFVDRINYFKKLEYEIKNENEILNDKITKLETAFSLSKVNTNLNWNQENINTEFNSRTNLNINFESKSDLFKHSNFKLISDPLSKILDLLSKIMYLSSEANLIDCKDEKYTIVMKFKRKLFPSNKIINPKLLKNEIIKLVNFSKEPIIFEMEEIMETLNSTGMKIEQYTGKLRITYEMLYHIIEELLIVNNYYSKIK